MNKLSKIITIILLLVLGVAGYSLSGNEKARVIPGQGPATTTTSGRVELGTVTETIAGTDTTRAVTAQGNAASEAVIKNPLAYAQGINMTAAASGSNGIQVADDTVNGNTDFGTGNFTLVWRGSLSNWTPSASSELVYKLTGGVGYSLEVRATTGIPRITLNTTEVNLAAPGWINGTVHDIAIVVTVGAVNTTLDVYTDGLPYGSQQSITNVGTVSNAASLYVMGTAAKRTSGVCHYAYTYNRALTAAEVLALYRGPERPDDSDKWGSQASLNLATLANSGTSAYDTFDGASTTAFHAITDGSDVARASTTDAISYVSGYKYKVSFTSSAVTGTAPTYGPAKDVDGAALTGGVQTNTVVAGVNTYEFTAGETATGTVVWSSILESGVTTEYTISLFSITKLGATLALEGEGMQPAPGQWLDSSSNKNHGMQPATGSSLVRPLRSFEIRWTNTWANTKELQYIGGVNQAVLPTSCYLTDIIGAISGTTIHDIIVGDGNDADEFVTITGGLATGTTSFTIASPISDGTNYKMTVTPDTEFTGSIRWTILGKILH